MPDFAVRVSCNCVVACADLWLGAVSLRLGSPRDVSLCSGAVTRDRVLRKDPVRHFASMLKNRLLGFAPEAFAFNPHSIDSPHLTPLKYLSTSGLWLGLLFAAAFLAAAVWQRRYRGPI